MTKIVLEKEELSSIIAGSVAKSIEPVSKNVIETAMKLSSIEKQLNQLDKKRDDMDLSMQKFITKVSVLETNFNNHKNEKDLKGWVSMVSLILVAIAFIYGIIQQSGGVNG